MSESYDRDPEKSSSSTTVLQDPIYIETLLSRRIELAVDECNPSLIQNHFLRKLQRDVEGKCIREGYVRPDSVHGITYTAGMVVSGDIQFEVFFKCDICHPLPETLFSVKFVSVTKAGIHAELVDEFGNNPVTVFLTRDMHIHDMKFLKYDHPEFAENNRFLRIKIIGIRYELHDLTISAIAEMV